MTDTPHGAEALQPKLDHLLDEYPVLLDLPAAHCEWCQGLDVAVTYGLDVYTAWQLVTAIRATIAETAAEAELAAETERLVAEQAAREAAEAAARAAEEAAQPAPVLPVAPEPLAAPEALPEPADLLTLEEPA